MAAAERNRRVARRLGGADDTTRTADRLPTLWIPVEAAITPDLLEHLHDLSAANSCRLIWHETLPAIEWRSAEPGHQLPDRSVRGAAVLDLSSSAARWQSAWWLLNRSGKLTDGWLSRHVHRRISRVFSYAFMTLGWSANVATVVTFVIGLAAAYLMAQTTHATMIAGGLLVWFTSIADGIDGEVARLTLSESRFGEQLDTGVDQLTHLSGLIGVLIGWWRQGIGPGGIGLAIAVLVGTPATLLWAMTLVRRARQADQFFVPTKPIETAIFRAAAITGARPLQAAAAIFVLFRREAFSCAVFLLALVTGQRAAIPVAIAAGLAVVIVTLAAYGQTLDRVMRETFDRPRADRSTTRPAQRSSAPA